jgi:hypothetical protein
MELRILSHAFAPFRLRSGWQLVGGVRSWQMAHWRKRCACRNNKR